MESASYKGYRIFGHAILQQEDILSPEQYAGSGTITRDTKMVEASGVSQSSHLSDVLYLNVQSICALLHRTHRNEVVEPMQTGSDPQCPQYRRQLF
ncbi:hypothetical protein [Paraburkholderia aspalathi]|uniref:hypothetical protein n=1 Tax=Paraburkholderia aspalathi TaxID=1324617 RepID=UPI0038B7DC45